MASGEAFLNSLRREVRRGVNHGLDLKKGWDRGVYVSILEMRVERAKENQRFGWLEEGGVGGVGSDFVPMRRANRRHASPACTDCMKSREVGGR